MSLRRGQTDQLTGRDGRRKALMARRLEGARVRKVSVWPPSWMAGPGVPTVTSVQSPMDGLTQGDIRPEDIATVQIIAQPARQTASEAPLPMRAIEDAPLPASVRFGRIPGRWSEAALATGLALAVFTFALWSIASFNWPRTHLPGDATAVPLPEASRRAQPGRDLPADADDPLWPMPPPHRIQPAAPIDGGQKGARLRISPDNALDAPFHTSNR